MTILAAGTKAPDFTLNATPDQQVSLQDFRGHPLIIAFYPADWSPVCGDQMALYNEVLPLFRQHHAEAARRSNPPMYGRSTSGMITLPSACW